MRGIANSDSEEENAEILVGKKDPRFRNMIEVTTSLKIYEYTSHKLYRLGDQRLRLTRLIEFIFSLI